jgi:hypothetical protein
MMIMRPPQQGQRCSGVWDGQRIIEGIEALVPSYGALGRPRRMAAHVRGEAQRVPAVARSFLMLIAQPAPRTTKI